jgi:hypothetical protein
VFGFEIVAMTRQLHIQQPDLHKVGLPFVVAFLPGAVLWSFGAILSLVHAGPTSMIDFVLVQGQRHVLWLFHLLG